MANLRQNAVEAGNICKKTLPARPSRLSYSCYALSLPGEFYSSLVPNIDNKIGFGLLCLHFAYAYICSFDHHFRILS
jgi:hypothetical protein